MIVVDASAVVSAHTDDGEAGLAIRERLLRAPFLYAPYLLDVEFVSAMTGMARGIRGGGPKLSGDELERGMTRYRELRIKRFEHLPLLPRVRQLSANLSACDATYVALAEACAVPLVTCDAKIERAGVARCMFETFESPD